MRVRNLFLFGAPRFEVEGQFISFHRNRALALAAVLAVSPEPQARDSLLALLWPVFETDDARNNLRRELSHLRALLGEDALIADRSTVVLNRSTLHVDLWAFEQRLDEARAHQASHPGSLCDACARSLGAAVDLYTADFLAGFGLPDSPAFDEWQSLERERLRRLAVGALDRLAAWRQGRGEHESAAGLAQRLLSLEPLHEPAHRLLMEALAASGQRPAALRHYDRLRLRLAEEVSAEPEPATSELIEVIRRAAGVSGTPDRPAIEVAGPVPVLLPTHATPFIGRLAAVAALIEILEDAHTHLLTLTGPGGMGKTRLAVRAARELAGRDVHRFPDGVIFVSLAGLSLVEGIPAAIADALDFSFRADGNAPPPDRQLLNYLRRRRLLLVLDNLEHLLDEGGAAFPAEIARAAPGVAVLVTSRFRLNVAGERLYPVSGLDTPAEAATGGDVDAALTFSAVALFAEAARRVRPGFALTSDNVAAVAAICRQVGGMPLAIEMAAAWLEALTLPEIAAEIQRGLDILATDLRDVPDRQRSIRAVCDASFRLLTEAERAILPCLAMFRDGFTREAAEALAQTDEADARGKPGFLQILLALVHKSWLSRDEDGRFQMHELLRQYAEEQLGATREATAERHARFFAGYLERLWPRLYGAGQLAARDAIAADIGNVLAAWEWFTRRGELTPLARQMLLPLYFYFLIRYQTNNLLELLDWTIANAAPGDGNEAARLMVRCARAAPLTNMNVFWWSDPDLIELWRSVSALERTEGLGYWYIRLAEQVGIHHDPVAGRAALRERATRAAAGDDWLLTEARRSLANLLVASGTGRADWIEAHEMLREAAAAYERSGNTFALALTLHELARVGGHTLTAAERLAMLDRVGGLMETLGISHIGWDWSWNSLVTRVRMGRLEGLFEPLHKARTQAQERGDRIQEVNILSWESTYALRYSTTDHAIHVRLEALTIDHEASFFDDVLWGWWNLGEIYRVRGDLAAARDYCEQALVGFSKLADPMGLSYCEFGFGALALIAGDAVEAHERLGRYVEMSRTMPTNWWNEAYAVIWLARAKTALGRHDDAATALSDALRLLVAREDYELGPWALAAAAELALAAGRPAVCAALCALLRPLPQTWAETRALLDTLATRAGAAGFTVAEPTAPLPAADLEALLDRVAGLPDAPAAEWLEGVARHVAPLLATV